MLTAEFWDGGKFTMKKKISFISLLCVFIVAAMLLTVRKGLFGPKEPSSAQEAKTVSLTLTYSGGELSWNRAVEFVCNRFMEKYPYIQIELSPSSSSNIGFYDDFLRTRIAKGELGDIIELHNGIQYAEHGYLAPITSDISNLVTTKQKYEGQVYQVGAYQTVYGLIYNKQLFLQLGLEEPQTYEEFISICETLKNYHLIPIALGGQDLEDMQCWINHFYLTDIIGKVPDWEQQYMNGNASWMDKEPENMLNHINELFANGYVVDNFRNISHSEAVQMLASGNVGMMYTGPWTFSQLETAAPELQYGWFFLPNETGDRYSYLECDIGWGISKTCMENTEKYDAANLFLSFFYSEGVYEQILDIMSAFSVTYRNIRLETGEIEKKIQMDVSYRLYLYKEESGPTAESNPLRYDLYNNILKMTAGEISREDVQNNLNQIGW